MAQSSFPFENVDTTETQFSQMFRTLNAGVNGTPAGTELKVSAGTGLQVSVALGQAMVRGHYYISTAAELLTISTANATNPRIDTIVLRLDPVANSIVLAVVAGTPAGSPVAPTLTQTDAGTYEFPLANVAVAAGAGTVGTITDRRVFMGKRLQSVGTSAARDIVFPAPVQGDVVWRDDLGTTETYFGLYNVSTNPGGRSAAGWYQEPIGRVLQTINNSSSTTVSTTGTVFTSAISVNITPKSPNSKILIFAEMPLYIYRASSIAGGYVGLFRNSSQLSQNFISSYVPQATITEYRQAVPMVYMDSPSTTSSVSYSLQIAALSGSQVDANATGPGQITVMEIAA